MGVVLVDISMSLDGFIAGPNDDVERLPDWLFSGDTPLGRQIRLGAPRPRIVPAVFQ